MVQRFFTPVRRNHVVGPAGVGSILVTRNGVTVLVCGLPTWLDTAPQRGSDPASRLGDREHLVRSHTLRDANAERSLGVNRFLVPPVVPKDDSRGAWFVPAVRFPTAEYCHNPSCRALSFASAESPSVGKCAVCPGPRASRTVQVPIVLVCPAGHLDEVDFVGLAHPDGTCSAPALTYLAGQNTSAPEVLCTGCGVRARLDPWQMVPCTGSRPWLPGFRQETCTESMRVLDRTSTSVYFPDVRSYLHIPAGGALRDAVLRWLQDDAAAVVLRSVPGNAAHAQILDQALPFFPDLTSASLAEHLAYLEAAPGFDEGLEGELDALTSGRRGIHTSDGPPVLDAELVDATRYDPVFVGPGAAVSRVVAVHRVAETRVLAGFSRVEPPSRAATGAPGFPLLWGHRPGARLGRDWLPGLRVYGEGVLLELNPERVDAWTAQNEDLVSSIDLNGELLTGPFQLAHTLAHLLMNAASLQCGYPVASLRDRIYAFPGRTALLVYTGDGDVLGTMGGLVELAQPGNLEPLLQEAYANARWCGLDPVCLNPVQHVKHDTAGACHQCCLLPETSCGWWNEGLDRALLIGREPLRGFLDLD